MNSVNNNVNFTGSKEVLYGLKKAASYAKTAEVCRMSSVGPRPILKDGEQGRAVSKMSAYLDMATFDDSFEKTIKKMPKKDIADLKENLAPTKCQYGIMKPLDAFKDSMVEMFSQNKPKSDKSFISSFIDKISK